MSAYNEYTTQFSDPKMLCEALKAMGFAEVELHAKAQNLYGYHGDMRSDKAEVIVRRKYVGSASNDIGFARQADGTFKAIISEFDRTVHNQKWLHKLAQTYTEKSMVRTAQLRGYQYAGKKIVNGKVKLEFLVR